MQQSVGKKMWTKSQDYWLFTVLVKPVLANRFLALWNFLEWTVNLKLNGALHVHLLDLYCKSLVAKNDGQNYATGHWYISRIGPTKVVNYFGIIELIYYMIPQYDLTMGFATLISWMEEWHNRLRGRFCTYLHWRLQT